MVKDDELKYDVLDRALKQLGDDARSGSSLQPVSDEEIKDLPALLDEVPRFADYARKPAPNFRLQRARPWQVDFGPEPLDGGKGAKGTTISITVAPRCLFRGERLIATDSWNPPGTGTRITQVLIGRRIQDKLGLPLPTSHFATKRPFRLDTCEKALSISLTVEFLEDCVFDATLHGRAVL